MSSDTPGTTDPTAASTPEATDVSDVSPAAAVPPASERPVLLTGVTAGIGRAAADQLAAKGHPLLLVARDAERGAAVVSAVRESSGNADVELLVADLSLMADVRRLAADVIARGRPLSVLINNAGVRLAERAVTAEGNETTLAVNHLAPYLLSTLLHDHLAADGGGRVVNVGSFMHKRGAADLDDLQAATAYHGDAVYSRSKLLCMLASYKLARDWEPDGVTVNVYNPGLVRTDMLLRGAMKFFGSLVAKSPALAADGLVFTAVSPRVQGVTGAYYQATGRMANSSATTYDEALQERVVEATEALLG